MKLEEYLKVIEQFMVDYLKSAHADGYVLGLSGGVDSSMVACLTKEAVGKDNLMGIMIPIHSLPEDLEDALELVNACDIRYEIIDASDIFDQYVESFKKIGVTLNRGEASNLKARIRMSILYAYAQNHNYLVLGTDNKDERYTGYFTKYGDGAADIYPVAKLVKGEIVQAAKILGVPTRLAERTPSAGLFPGQTDESEMGIKYVDLDAYLLGKQIPEEVVAKIERLHRITEHKRIPVPEPEEFYRD